MLKQVAILIDGDNISHKYAKCIKQEASQYGNIKISRLYGSVTSPNVKMWYNVMPVQGILPVLQITYAKGKSIADQALTIDAMDLLHIDDIDVFCIISSDSDFTKLVYRLKEAGKVVIGMGESKTTESLAKACDEFKILDFIFKNTEETTNVIQEAETEIANLEPEVIENTLPSEIETEELIEESKISISTESEIIRFIREFIENEEEDRVNLSEVGNVLKQTFLGFDARNYDYKNMTDMLRHYADDFELFSDHAPDGIHRINYVSLKQQ